MKTNRNHYSGILAAICLTAVTTTLFAAPLWRTRPVTDLLKGEEPFEDTSFNVGATGFRGWVFHRGTDSSESRQILVKNVDTNSPAFGLLEVGDLILGADGKGAAGDPKPFDSDARRSIADSIQNAEARDPATLKLLRRRNGANETVTLTLETMGAYSATAPYNCDKSRKILAKCAKAFYEADDPGSWSLGILALLAVNDPQNPDNKLYQEKAREWARALIVPASEIHPNQSKVAWPHSYRLIILSEYYLQTKDAEVLPTLEAYADCYARNQSWFGTTGHQYATKRLDGGDNGPMAGYGAINGTGVAGFLGLVLAREAGIESPELDAAIDRANTFFSSFVTKSGIPYGEHSYGDGKGMYDMNGKNATAALAFMLQDDAVEPTKYYARLAAASGDDRQASHAGPFFNYVWPPLGAAAVGEAAAAHYFKRTSWLYDLERTWDGSIVFDHFGHSPKYRGFPGALYTLLTYALPLRQLHITGRGHDKSRWLSDAEVKAVVAAEDFDAEACSTKQLISALSSWAPQVRHASAEKFAERIKEDEKREQFLARLHSVVNDSRASAGSRNAICQVLRFVGDPSSAPVMVERLGDSDSYVRYGAAAALRYLPREAVMPHINAILRAAATGGKPAFPLVKGDPIQFAHHQLAMLLFYNGNAYGPKGLLAQSIEGIDRNLLWPAVRAVAKTPSGQGRSTVGSVYKQLSREETLELADAIIESVRVVAPADAMFAGGIRMQGADVLQKYGVAEGVPLVRSYADRLGQHYPKVLGGYGGAVLASDSDTDIMQFIYDQWAVRGLDLASLVDSIMSGTNTVSVTVLKRIDSVMASEPVLTLPAKATTLRVDATDPGCRDEKDTVYTWRKVYGAGGVTFRPNGTWDSKTTTMEFSGQKPGKYRFEVTMSDVLGYTVARDTVDVTLLAKKTLFAKTGKLPRNQPPKVESLAITAQSGVPVPVVLRGMDPDGDDLAFIVDEAPSHGHLSGVAPDLQYVADFGYIGRDRITFSVVDGQGVACGGTVNVSVVPSRVGVVVYEGFGCAPGKLDGQTSTSSIGLKGNWSVGKNSYDVATGSLNYAVLPATGNMITVPSWGRKPRATRAIDTDALTRSGILDHGREMWFSTVIGVKKECNRTNGFIFFGLRDRAEESTADVGFKFALGNLHAMINGEQAEGRSRASRAGNITFPAEKPHLVVGHCRWGKTAKDPDTVELYRVLDIPRRGPVLLEEPISVLSGHVLQERISEVYFEYNERFYFDEIRVGPSYESVLLGTVPLAAGE